MSTYSEILDNLSSVKSREQYSGFNPLSIKKRNPDNTKFVLTIMAIMLVIFLLALLVTGWLSNHKTNVDSTFSSIDTSGVENNADKTDFVLLEKNINQAKLEVELLIKQQAYLDNLKTTESTESKESVLHDFPIVSNKLVISPANKDSDTKVQVLVSSAIQSNQSKLKNNGLASSFTIENERSVKKIEPIENHSITTNSAKYNVDQLLNMVKDQQFERALTLSEYLNETQQKIVQAKVYEKTDIDQAIRLYQELIATPNSPIEYVLKLAILNEQSGHSNQALYYYQLFNRHNTDANQDIALYVNKKISDLKNNRGEL